MRNDKQENVNINERRKTSIKNDENKIEVDYDSEKERHYVRCLKCGQILQCSRYDSGVLLDHIRKEHPEIEVVDAKTPTEMATSNEHCALSQCSMPSNKTPKDSCGSPEISLRAPGPDSEKKKCCNSAKSQSSQNQGGSKKSQPQNEVSKMARFRASIELWRPLDGCLYCPHCDCTKAPVVKTRNELCATNNGGSVCILSCWPLCFLPFCVSDDKKYLHCCNCNTFLGIYDRNCNSVRPNKNYIEPPNNCNK